MALEFEVINLSPFIPPLLLRRGGKILKKGLRPSYTLFITF